MAELRASFVLADKDGLHARSCSRIARAAKKFRCRAEASYAGRKADAASVFELLGLNAPGGAVLEFTADGRDAAECLDAIGRAVAET